MSVIQVYQKAEMLSLHNIKWFINLFKSKNSKANSKHNEQ